MNKKQAGSLGGKKTWAKVSKKERSRIMSERAKLLWKKIREGNLTKA